MNRQEAIGLSAETGKYIEGDLRAPRELNDQELEAELAIARRYREAAYMRSNGSTSGSIVNILERLDRRLEDLQHESDRRGGETAHKLATANYDVDKKTHRVTVLTFWVAVAALVFAALGVWLQWKERPTSNPPGQVVSMPSALDGGE